MEKPSKSDLLSPAHASNHTEPQHAVDTLIWDQAPVEENPLSKDPICFTPGTKIATLEGLRPIETLQRGDLVLTRDHGFQPVRWTWARTAPGIGRFAPVRVRSGTIHGQTEDLVLSARHRLLLPSGVTGKTETLGWAGDLVSTPGISQFQTGFVTYIHVLFDAHELVLTNGVWTESLYADDAALEAISPEAREELFTLFPHWRSHTGPHGPSAREILCEARAKQVFRETTRA